MDVDGLTGWFDGYVQLTETPVTKDLLTDHKNNILKRGLFPELTFPVILDSSGRCRGTEKIWFH